MHAAADNRRCFIWAAAALMALLVVFVCLTVSVNAEPGLTLSDGQLAWYHLDLEPPAKDTLVPVELQRMWKPDLSTVATSRDAWSFNLDSMVIARVDSLDLETYLAFRDRDEVKGGWNSHVNSLLRKTELERRGELRIGLALPSAVESIVGEGGAGLRVSGYRKILFSGRSQWTDAASTSTVRQSKFPSLSMEQISSFTVEGTIGSKISVKVDQDSKRTSDLDNRIIIRYKGDEDDILQSVDLGNTTLSLSDAKFIGYSQSIQGLFGVSATAKLGPVDIKMIASQEKGNTTSNRLVAGANEQSIIIRDFSYDRYRFFDVGFLGDEMVLSPGDTVVSFRLYMSGNSNVEIPFANAYGNWLDTANSDPIFQRFEELSIERDYQFFGTEFYLWFPRRLQNVESKALAYYMLVKKADGSQLEVGSLTGDTLGLQLLKRQQTPPTDPLWNAEWKNVYDLRIRDIEWTELNLGIFKGILGDEENPANVDHRQDGTRYLSLLGLDDQDASGAPGADGKIDDDPLILDLQNGLLVFPNRFPFTSDALASDTVADIYTSNDDQTRREASKYYIEIVSRQRAKQLQLGVVNIIPESEVVTLNGSQRLNRGSDYTIDYGLGVIEFRDEKALDENANITVDYEYSPFLTVEKRTLLGFAAKYESGPNFRTGATLLYKGTKATDRPAQLGQEPFRDVVGEVFLRWRAEPSFLTRMADALPMVETTAKSTLDFQAAVARSMPNPNTKGVVFIDDFQGAKRAQNLGIIRETWSLASPPLIDPEGGTGKRRNRVKNLGFLGLSDLAFTWTNPWPRFDDTDIYDRIVESGSNSQRRQTHVLVLDFRPHESPTLEEGESPRDAWGGVMRALPVSTWKQQRAEYIEFRMAVVSDKRDESQRVGTLHLDLGRISEDINDDDVLNTEDKPVSGILNKVLDDGEDVGLDGLPDSLEQSADGTPYDPVTNPDPAGDNWSITSSKSDSLSANELSRDRHINGTDQNLRDPIMGRIPNTEDIGGESEFDRINAYYGFSIDLGDLSDPSLVENSEKTITSNETSIPEGFDSRITWRTYRIPLWDNRQFQRFFDSGVQPDSSAAIQFARLWIDSADTSLRIYIAAIDIVERTWSAKLALADTTKLPTDEVFRIGVVNTEENGDYVQPPGVRGYRDPRLDETEKEQALLVEWENLGPQDGGKAFFLNSGAEDYSGYRTLSMWVFADSAADRNAEVFLRFGQNEQNYYYYRDTLVWVPDTIANWETNRIVIDFNELTALKDTASRGATDTAAVYSPTLKLGVVGNPSLTNVIRKEIGIVRTAAGGKRTAKIWANELELGDARKDPGLAASGSLTLQMADLIGFTATLEGQNYSFRRLTSGRTGTLASGSSRLRSAVSGSFSLHKFAPEGLGLNLPISANYSKTVATPRLLTGSDIVLTPDRQEDERSTTISYGFSTRIAVTPKKAGWLVDNTIGALSGRFSASRTKAWTPTVPFRDQEDYTASADYRLTIGKPVSFPALIWTRFFLMPRRVWDTPFSPLPTEFSAGASVRRSRSYSLNNRGLVTNSYTRDLRGNAATRMSLFPALSLSYNMATTRDLSDPEEVELSLSPKDLRLGRETDFTQKLTSSYAPNLVSFITGTRLTYSANFRDRIDKRFRDHDVNIDRTVSVGTSFDPRRFWGFLGARQQGAGRRSGSPRVSRMPRAQTPAQAAGDSTKTDSTQAQPAPHSGGGVSLRDAWAGFMNGLNWLTSPIGTMSINYSHGDGDSRQLLRDRPSLRYQFGIDLDEEVPIASNVSTTGFGQQSSKSKRDDFNVKNNIDFLGILTFNSSYTNRKSTNLRERSETSKETVEFPAITTGLNRLEKFKPIGWFFATSSAKFGYTKSEDRTFEAGALRNIITTEAFAPLFSLNGSLKKGIQLTLVMDRSSTETNPERSQGGGSPTLTKTRQTRITSSYSFSSPNGIPLPFLRSIRLKSRMSLSTTITFKTTETFQGSSGQFDVRTQRNAETNISFRSNYSFSTRVRGGTTLEWIDREIQNQGSGRQKTHVRAVSIWAEFSF